ADAQLFERLLAFVREQTTKHKLGPKDMWDPAPRRNSETASPAPPATRKTAPYLQRKESPAAEVASADHPRTHRSAGSLLSARSARSPEPDPQAVLQRLNSELARNPTALLPEGYRKVTRVATRTVFEPDPSLSEAERAAIEVLDAIVLSEFG